MIREIPDTSIKFEIRDNYHTDDIVITEVWDINVYEVEDKHFNNGGVVVDLGANIGSFSIYAACRGAKVYAVEPEPGNLTILNKNILLNNMKKHIVVAPYAISNYKGTAKITDRGGNSTIKDENSSGSEVEVLPLDNFFSLYNINNVDVLKIDIEGAEVETILGASKVSLMQCKFIAIELDKRSGEHMGDMVKKLSETHHVRTMGSWERGGMIWAWLY